MFFSMYCLSFFLVLLKIISFQGNDIDHLLMVETDAPYLGFPGCRIGYKKSAAGQNPNVPSSLPLIVKTLAKVLQRDVNEIAMITSQNAENFFGFPKNGGS